MFAEHQSVIRVGRVCWYSAGQSKLDILDKAVSISDFESFVVSLLQPFAKS